MKITFLGLSCFLIEDNSGGKLLIDAFKDSPEYSLGLILPKDLHADIFLASHTDSDHSNLDEGFAAHKQASHQKDKSSIDIFSGLNLRGTLVKEWNGDLCVAYHFTIDGMRCLHLADNSHILSAKQIEEFGKIDLLFLPMPKSKSNNIDMEIEIIEQLNPKIIIPSHAIPLPTEIVRQGYNVIKRNLDDVVLPNTKNPHANNCTVEVFTHMLLALEELSAKLPNKEIKESSVEIKTLPDKPTIYKFEKCQAVVLKTQES